LAQWDLWQPDTDIPLGFGQVDKLWVVAGVSGFSRLIGAWMVPTRAAHDVLGGMNQVLRQIGGVPRTAVWDQEGCIGQWRRGEQVLTEAALSFAGSLGMGFRLCEASDPEAKGVVERANGYFETSFLPGRSFTDIDDFNRQLVAWLTKRANVRVHATTRVRPAEAIFEDRGSMLALPEAMPDVAWRHSIRLPRDHYVRVETNDYSVNPRFVGRRVEITLTLDEVVVTCEGTEVARHRRCLASHQTILAAEHARVLRQMRIEARAVDALAHALADDGVEVRDLAVYDRVAS
jgi:hypothetical protein